MIGLDATPGWSSAAAGGSSFVPAATPAAAVPTFASLP